MDDLEPQTKAKFLVAQYFNDHRENPAEIAELTLNDVQITSFSKHYRNWKATATTNANDGIHYDVSYNGYLSETHLVIYKHVTRVVIADQR